MNVEQQVIPSDGVQQMMITGDGVQPQMTPLMVFSNS